MKSVIFICFCVVTIWAVPVEKKPSFAFEQLKLNIAALNVSENGQIKSLSTKNARQTPSFSFEQLKLNIAALDKNEHEQVKLHAIKNVQTYSLIKEIGLSIVKNSLMENDKNEKNRTLSFIKQLGLKVIGGNTATDGQFPWQVSIFVRKESTSFYCGGALVDLKWVLTDANCIYGAKSFTLRLGSNSLTNPDIHRVIVETTQSTVHPNFNPLTLENDIGLIRIDQPISLNDRIQVVSLAYKPLASDVKVTVSGWGATNPDSGISYDLNYADLTTISNIECRSQTGEAISDQLLCAVGGNTKGICVGDSGSPLVAQDANGKFIHVGVATWASSSGCETRQPSRYTRTATFIEWIHSVINE